MAGGKTTLRLRKLLNRLRAFRSEESGNIAVVFGIASIPIMTGMGAAIDYSRVNSMKDSLQSALDSGLLAGARDGSTTWSSIATDVFNSNFVTKATSVQTPAFTKVDSTTYSGSVTASISTSILGMVGISYVAVTVNAKASAAEGDNSCILTLDHNQPKSHVSLSLNGAPVVNLSGCSIRSNTSLDCNGHDGGLAKSYASGSAAGCGKPNPNAAVVPDTFQDLAKNITKVCGSDKTGVTWNPGIVPTGASIKTVARTGYNEYHICGDLKLSGSGHLISSAPPDTVIIIENGSLIVDDNASVTALKTSFVLTGDNNSNAKIDFPTGNGKTGALTVSPPTTVGNPWQAVSIYLDPALTKYVDNSWGPGADFNADGLVYLGNSNVVTDGNTSSSNSKCTKFVMNSFTTNGKVTLDFAQQNCAAIGLKQWDGIGVYLVS
jgi:Flp pilus assembly protein TadG